MIAPSPRAIARRTIAVIATMGAMALAVAATATSSGASPPVVRSAAAAAYGTDWDLVVILVAHNDGGSPGVYQPPYRQMLDRFAVNSANPGATGRDGLHLSATGARLMAGLIADQVGVAEFEQIPTTTTEAAVLIPAASIIRSTTTSPPAAATSSTVPTITLRSVAEGPTAEAPPPSPSGDPGGQDTAVWVWPLLAASFAATAALVVRNKGTLPR